MVKVMIFWRGKASYLYNSKIVIRESQRKPRKYSGFFEDDFNNFREIPSIRRNFWKGFPKVVEVLASL